MKVYIGTDHRGVDIEKEIVKHLIDENYEVVTTKYEHDPKDDYPDFAFEVANSVANDENSKGILICGTGIGMSIAANKVKKIRAAHCSSVSDASWARVDNDANVICVSYNLPVNVLCEMIDTFLTTDKDEDERHVRRINKISEYECGTYHGL